MNRCRTNESARNESARSESACFCVGRASRCKAIESTATGSTTGISTALTSASVADAVGRVRKSPSRFAYIANAPPPSSRASTPTTDHTQRLDRGAGTNAHDGTSSSGTATVSIGVALRRLTAFPLMAPTARDGDR